LRNRDLKENAGKFMKSQGEGVKGDMGEMDRELYWKGIYHLPVKELKK